MSKGDGIKYLNEMRIKSEILLHKAFLKNPNEPPAPPKGYSMKEILDEAIRREKNEKK